MDSLIKKARELNPWRQWDTGRLALFFIGWGWVSIGMTWISIPSETRALGIDWTPLVSQHGGGWMLVICGLISATLGAGNIARRVAFMMLFFAPAFLAGLFLVSFFASFTTYIPGGSVRSLTSFFSYLIFAISVSLLARSKNV